MPCDTVTLQSVALKKADPMVLVEALESIGYRVEVNEKTGRILASRGGYDSVLWTRGEGIEITSTGDDGVKEVVQAYGRTAVSWAARRAGWKVEEISGNQFKVRKAYL